MPLKIVYAASDREGGSIQLLRFLQAVRHKNYNIKIAAFPKSNPGISINWNLDCLKDMFNQDNFTIDNDNLRVYYDQIKLFKPDLIISDLELYTSYIANTLNIKLWQASPLLIPYSHSFLCKLPYRSSYAYFYRNNNSNILLKNLLANSEKKFIYSHLGDANVFKIEEGFEWIRPYYIPGKSSRICEHEIVACTFKNDKKIIDLVKQYEAVVFSKFKEEKYKNLIFKNLEDSEEYICNLKNCKTFISRGHTDFLADAYYNSKYSIIMPNVYDTECLINTMYSKLYKIASAKYTDEEIINKKIEPNFNVNIKQLHEKIEEFF